MIMKHGTKIERQTAWVSICPVFVCVGVSCGCGFACLCLRGGRHPASSSCQPLPLSRTHPNTTKTDGLAAARASGPGPMPCEPPLCAPHARPVPCCPMRTPHGPALRTEADRAVRLGGDAMCGV
jgi:hypothetical protein